MKQCIPCSLKGATAATAFQLQNCTETYPFCTANCCHGAAWQTATKRAGRKEKGKVLLHMEWQGSDTTLSTTGKPTAMCCDAQACQGTGLDQLPGVKELPQGLCLGSLCLLCKVVLWGCQPEVLLWETLALCFSGGKAGKSGCSHQTKGKEQFNKPICSLCSNPRRENCVSNTALKVYVQISTSHFTLLSSFQWYPFSQSCFLV